MTVEYALLLQREKESSIIHLLIKFRTRMYTYYNIRNTAHVEVSPMATTMVLI